MKMKFKKWLKAFLRTEQKYHQALKRLASPEGDTENLYGMFEDETVPDKKELRKHLRKKILAEIEQNNEKINDPKEILDPVELVRKERESDRLYNLTNDEKKEELLESEEVKEEYEKLNVMYEIKKQIIRYRIENNLTQKELADRIGTKQSAISRLENDDYNPSVEFLDKVAHALGKKLEIRFN